MRSAPTAARAIRNLFKVDRDTTGNMPPLPGIFPDMMAPVVRTSRDGDRVLEMMRWGFPPAGHQCAQHRVRLLAWLASAAVPLSRERPHVSQILYQLQARTNLARETTGLPVSGPMLRRPCSISKTWQ
jgi:putative SOS response-associated peptidase YedK